MGIPNSLARAADTGGYHGTREFCADEKGWRQERDFGVGMTCSGGIHDQIYYQCYSPLSVSSGERIHRTTVMRCITIVSWMEYYEDSYKCKIDL